MRALMLLLSESRFCSSSLKNIPTGSINDGDTFCHLVLSWSPRMPWVHTWECFYLPRHVSMIYWMVVTAKSYVNPLTIVSRPNVWSGFTVWQSTCLGAKQWQACNSVRTPYAPTDLPIIVSSNENLPHFSSKREFHGWSSWTSVAA